MASTDRGWIHLRQLVSPGEVDAILAASRQVAEIAADAQLVDEGWTAERARR